MADRYVYFFGADQTEGDGTMKELLGGKGAGLAEMARIGVPVPPGFTITTEVCRLVLGGGAHPAGLEDEVAAALARLEAATGKTFGGGDAPLLSLRALGREVQHAGDDGYHPQPRPQRRHRRRGRAGDGE